MVRRRIHRLTLLLSVATVSCGADDEFVLDCKTTFPGELSYDDLVDDYGADNLSSEAIHVGEGIIENATVLFAASDRKRLEIFWHDLASAKNPRAIRVHGEDSEWKLPSGIGLGDSMIDVQNHNGRSFELMGFAWDYAGTVVDWKGGALEDVDGSACRTAVRLNTEKYTESATNLVNFMRLVGDTVFSSDNPDYVPLEPTVYEIALFYE